MESAEDGVFTQDFPFVLPETLEKCNKELQDTKRYGPLKICIGKIEIGERESNLFAKALQTSKNLTHLLLVYTKLSTPVLQNIISGLKKTRSLYHLDLSFTGIRDDGAAVIAEFLKKNRTVGILNLDNNKIANVGASHLAESLESNKMLSVLTLRQNKFDKTVVRPFLAALKINKIIYGIELGIESMRLNSALKNNELYRAVVFDNVLSKPNLSKTRFGACKISVIGESKCGKSMFLQGLLSNERVSKRALRHQTVNTFQSNTGSSENFPQVRIRNIKTSPRIGLWEEVKEHDNFLMEHALKTTHLLLMRQVSKKAKEAKAEESKSVLKKKRSLGSQLSLRRKKKSIGGNSEGGTSITESDSDDYGEQDVVHKKLTMTSLSSFKSMGGTLRKTQIKKDKSRRQNSVYSDALSGFDEAEADALRRGTTMTISTGTTSSSGSTKGEEEKEKSKKSMREVKVKKPKGVKLAIDKVIPQDDEDEIEIDYNSIDLEEYAQKQEEEYRLEVADEIDPVSESKAFTKLQKKYRKLKAKQDKIAGATAPRGTRLKVSAPRRQSEQDFDRNLRAFSVHSRKKSIASSVASEGSKKKGFAGTTKHLRKTRLVKHQANEHMTRHFSDSVFMKVKSRVDGLDLSVWEMSDNNKNDAMFTGLYNSFLSRDGYGPTIICFDLNRMVPNNANKSVGRKNLVYYLKLAKSKADAKILLVGTKLDRIKQHSDLSLINAEVKKALKEADISRLLVNSQSKLLYHPIDIVRNYGLAELRKKIEKVCKNLEQVKRHLTLADLCFLDYLTAEKYDDDDHVRTSVDFHEALFWGESIGLDRVRIESVMKLFSTQGLILYFPRLRAVESVVVHRVRETIKAICSLFNVEDLNSTYDELYNRKGFEEDDIEHVNGYKRNFLVTRPIIDTICGVGVDSDFVINFLREKLLLSDWIFDTELFYKNINVENNIEPRHLDADVYMLPSLLNDRTTINNFARLKDTRLSTTSDNRRDEILGDAEKYEIFFEAHDKTMFPSSFFAAYITSYINFLTHLKTNFDKMNNFDKSKKHGLYRTNIVIHNTTGAPVVKIIVDRNFGFYIKGSRTGIRVFVHPKMRQGAFASFVFAFGMVDKVNKDILGLNLSFGIRVRMKGKFKSLRKLKQNVSSLQEVFTQFAGTNTFRVGKGISGIESYLRESARM